MIKKSTEIKLENILSPKEIEERFGSQYCIVRNGDREVYINSDYFVEILGKYWIKDNKGRVDSKKIIRLIPYVYRHIIRDFEYAEKNKRCKSVWDEILSRRIKR